MAPWHVTVFPALFTARMPLVETTDSVVMTGAYGWAFVNPRRKLRYNLAITAASVLVALLMGGIETLGLLGDQLALTGPFWDAIGRANDSLGCLGFAVVGSSSRPGLPPPPSTAGRATNSWKSPSRTEAGGVNIAQPVPAALLGNGVDDEVEIVVDGRSRRVVIEKIAKAA